MGPNVPSGSVPLQQTPLRKGNRLTRICLAEASTAGSGDLIQQYSKQAAQLEPVAELFGRLKQLEAEVRPPQHKRTLLDHVTCYAQPTIVGHSLELYCRSSPLQLNETNSAN
jgi:hypothetical protein